MSRLVFSLVAMAGASAALADFSSNFESPTYGGSDVGMPLTFGFGGGGVDGWFLPVNGSRDYDVYTYTGNALGISANPTGGDQFIGEASGGGSAFGRAQHAHDFSAASTWTTAYDATAVYAGVVPSAINLGSFSLQDSVTARFFIALNNWMDVNDPTLGWKIEFNVFDAGGVSMVNQSPGPEWTNLTYNGWYRNSITFDFVTNQITEVSITNIATGTTTTANPTTWYLQGGAGGGSFPIPTHVRFFTGGQAGNVMAWDNLAITEAGGCDDCDGDTVCDEDENDCNQDGEVDDCDENHCAADLAAPFGGVLNVFDFLAFQTAFSNSEPCADLAAPFGTFNVFDFLAFQTAFGNGC